MAAVESARRLRAPRLLFQTDIAGRMVAASDAPLKGAKELRTNALAIIASGTTTNSKTET
jgi:hypothetical protein